MRIRPHFEVCKTAYAKVNVNSNRTKKYKAYKGLDKVVLSVCERGNGEFIVEEKYPLAIIKRNSSRVFFYRDISPSFSQSLNNYEITFFRSNKQRCFFRNIPRIEVGLILD